MRHAMVLAAGRGERMRPLTDHTPKPLLQVGGLSLLARALLRIEAQGIHQIVVNAAHLAEQVEAFVADWARARPHLVLRLSREPHGALETAGGIALARPWSSGSEPEPFLLINGDVYWDGDLGAFLQEASQQEWCGPSPDGLVGFLGLIDNPDHHPGGDFSLTPQGLSLENCPGSVRLTYSGVSVLHPTLVHSLIPGERAALGPLLQQAARAGRLSGTRLGGLWMDVGTPERLQALERRLSEGSGGAAARSGHLT